MSGLSLETYLFKFEVRIALTVLELPVLTFNAQKFRESRDHDHAPF